MIDHLTGYTFSYTSDIASKTCISFKMRGLYYIINCCPLHPLQSNPCNIHSTGCFSGTGVSLCRATNKKIPKEDRDLLTYPKRIDIGIYMRGVVMLRCF
jgi:hypothetical protein